MMNAQYPVLRNEACFVATAVQTFNCMQQKLLCAVDRGNRMGREGRGGEGVLCHVELAKDKLRVANSCYMCTDCPKRECAMH